MASLLVRISRDHIDADQSVGLVQLLRRLERRPIDVERLWREMRCEAIRQSQGRRELRALGAAQAIEHYEIARYGTLAAWAKQLGNAEAERLLRETLVEEEKTDKLLTDLAEATINAAAEQQAA